MKWDEFKLIAALILGFAGMVILVLTDPPSVDAAKHAADDRLAAETLAAMPPAIIEPDSHKHLMAALGRKLMAQVKPIKVSHPKTIKENAMLLSELWPQQSAMKR